MADELRKVRVVLETSRQRIVGEVALPAEGIRTRFSDLLNREGLSFISLVNASVVDHDGAKVSQHSFIGVARQHVQVAYEDEGPGAGVPPPA